MKTVVFEDEVDIMRHVINDEGTKLMDMLTMIRDDQLISRLFECSLKRLRALSFKTLYFSRPSLAPQRPLTIMTGIFINYKESRHTDKYIYMIDSATEIFKFLLEYDMVSGQDMEYASNWAAYANFNDLGFLGLE